MNQAFTWNPYRHFLAHTPAYTQYLTDESWAVRAYCRRNRLQPIKEFTPILLYFFLRNARSDSHNYKKALFDVLEKGGLFENDRFILDRTISVAFDKIRPRIEIVVARPGEELPD